MPISCRCVVIACAHLLFWEITVKSANLSICMANLISEIPISFIRFRLARRLFSVLSSNMTTWITRSYKKDVLVLPKQTTFWHNLINKAALPVGIVMCSGVNRETDKNRVGEEAAPV